MTLTKDQEQATLKAFNEHLNIDPPFTEPPTEDGHDWGSYDEWDSFRAATEWKQDEIAKLRVVIAVAKKYVDSFDGRTVGGRTHDFLQEFRLVYGVHGIDQREAKGDGDERGK